MNALSTDKSDRDRIRRFAGSDQQTPMRLAIAPFATGMQADLLHIDREARRVELRYRLDAEYVAARGTLQGGALATMLDASMVFATLALLPDDKSAATASINVAYLKPAFPGVYHAQAEIDRLGRSLAFVRASLCPDGGDPVATATGVISIFDRQPDPRP